VGIDVAFSPFGGAFLDRLSLDVGVDWALLEHERHIPLVGEPPGSALLIEHAQLFTAYAGVRAVLLRIGPIDVDLGPAMGVSVELLEGFGRFQSETLIRARWMGRVGIRGTHDGVRWSIEGSFRGPFTADEEAESFTDDTLAAVTVAGGLALAF
jgi:hypothetical protein